MDLSSILELDKIVLLVLLLILTVVYLRLQSTTCFPGGPWSLPFIGNYKLLQSRPHIRLTQFREKFGDTFSITIGRRKVVVVSSLEGINEGLVKKSLSMSGRPADLMSSMFSCYNPEEGIYNSSLNMNFKIKKDFTLRSLDRLCCSRMVEDVIYNEAERLAFFILAQARPCDLSLILESTMLRLMLYLVNGKLYEATDENFIEIWRTFRMDSEIAVTRWDNITGFQFLQRSSTYTVSQIRDRTKLHYAYQRDIVNRHKDCFNPDIVGDIVDHALVMLERNEDMGVLTQDELDSLFVEVCGSGHRQLTSVMLWFILYVAFFPDVQDKIYAELMSVVGKSRLPKLFDQPYLTYTCAVILETQRLASVMPFLYPHISTEDTPFMGYSIPKDTVILFNIWSLHHDSKHWKHPMKFDPERFLDDGALHIPDCYLPFGDGLRSCPGEGLADIQLFTFVTVLMYHLRFTLPEDPDIDGVFQGFVLTPKPYKVIFTAREAGVRYEEPLIQPDVTETAVCLLDNNDI